MAVEILTIQSGPYIGAGAEQTYPVDFQSSGADEIVVTVDGVEVEDYVFNRNEDGRGSVVGTFTGEVMIFSEPDFSQEVVFQQYGPYFPDALNEPLDRAAMRDLWLKDATTRAIAVPRGEQGSTLPFADDRANTVMGFDTNGNASVQPVVATLQAIGVTIHDDGAWIGADTPVDDGVWG